MKDRINKILLSTFTHDNINFSVWVQNDGLKGAKSAYIYKADNKETPIVGTTFSKLIPSHDIIDWAKECVKKNFNQLNPI